MTGTGEMIERVAKAICQADEQNGGPSWEYVRSLGERGVSGYFDRARAAIEAIANTHLIAAAPDLYAALLDAVEQLEFWGGDTTQASVILARSRGETQAKPAT